MKNALSYEPGLGSLGFAFLVAVATKLLWVVGVERSLRGTSGSVPEEGQMVVPLVVLASITELA